MSFFPPSDELEFTFARSSGPGGQNVNKVNSKAVLRWNLLESTALTEEKKAILLQKLEGRISKNGDLILTCDQFRDQPRNRDGCLLKLRELLVKAFTKPKARRKTKPTRGSQIRRVDSKKRHSEKKRMRRTDL